MKPQSVVLLHGWGLSGSIFSPLTTTLTDLGYRVYSPDLPGFGDTQPPPTPLTLRQYSEFLHMFLQENTIKNPVLIGHSFGGRICLKYDAMYPKVVRGIILSGTPGFSPVSKKKLLLFMALAKIGKIFFSLPPLSYFQEAVRNWYYYIIGAREFFRAKGAMRDTFKYVVQENLTHAMESLSVPSLLIWGEYDIIVPVSIAHRMEHLIPDTNLIILPESDHGVPYKRSGEFASYAHRFIRSL